MKRNFYKIILLSMTAVYLSVCVFSTGILYYHYKNQHEKNADNLYSYMNEVMQQNPDYSIVLFDLLRMRSSYSDEHQIITYAYKQKSEDIYYQDGIYLNSYTGPSANNVPYTANIDLTEYMAENELRTLYMTLENCKESDFYTYENTVVFDTDHRIWEILICKNKWEESNAPVTTSPYTGIGAVLTDEDEDGTEHRRIITSYEPVYIWHNPEIPQEVPLHVGLYQQCSFSFPSQYWQKWLHDETIQDNLAKARNELECKTENQLEYQHLGMNNDLYRRFIRSKDKDSSVWIVSVSHPLSAALSYLKYVYLTGFLMTLFCGIITAKQLQKSFEKQKLLEETRRDFTDAMAHEMKTPLSVIRGYAENVLLDVKENKKDYYLQQIIKEADTMDQLIRKMLEVSRMDSQRFVPQQNPIRMDKLFNAILPDYKPVIEKKHLEMVTELHPWTVTGDEKAFTGMLKCLVDNAISYSDENASVTIRCEEKSIIIQNKCAPVSKDVLRFSFSSSSKKGHNGFGLYYAKKVADAYHLCLTMENKDNGIITTIKG